MDRLKLALTILASAVIGGAVVWLLQGYTLRIQPADMSYSDFVAIILSAISALVAVFGLGLALFTIWGVSQFRKGVEAKIVEITPVFLAREFESGGSRQILDNLVVEFFKAELASPGMAEAWAAEKARQNASFDDVDAEQRE